MHHWMLKLNVFKDLLLDRLIINYLPYNNVDDQALTLFKTPSPSDLIKEFTVMPQKPFEIEIYARDDEDVKKLETAFNVFRTRA